jgi:AcrR family transcriptional regulator
LRQPKKAKPPKTARRATASRALQATGKKSLRRESAVARGPQKRGELTRQNLLEAALRLIAREGLGAVRMRAVAEEARVSLGVTTYHFPSRRDLLSAAFELHLLQTDAAGGEFSEQFGAAWQADSLTLDELTDAVVRLLSFFVHDERDSFVASQELTLEVSRDPVLASRVKHALSNHHRLVVEMVESVGSPEPELDGEILSATLQGLALKWLSREGDPEFEKRLRKVVRRLMERFLTGSAAGA